LPDATKTKRGVKGVANGGQERKKRAKKLGDWFGLVKGGQATKRKL